jgi:hypothetical protein
MDFDPQLGHVVESEFNIQLSDFGPIVDPSVAPGMPASKSPGNLLEMQISNILSASSPVK